MRANLNRIAFEKDSSKLNKPIETIDDLTRYDFSETIIITRKDEFGQIGNALNTAQENVSNLVKVIMKNSQDIKVHHLKNFQQRFKN